MRFFVGDTAVQLSSPFSATLLHYLQQGALTL